MSEAPLLRRVFQPLRHIVDFGGRTRRADYWPFILTLLGLWFAELIVEIVVIPFRFGSPIAHGYAVFALFVLLAFAATVRRLHDVGWSGRWMAAYSALMLGFIATFFYWRYGVVHRPYGQPNLALLRLMPLVMVIGFAMNGLGLSFSYCRSRTAPRGRTATGPTPRAGAPPEPLDPRPLRRARRRHEGVGRGALSPPRPHHLHPRVEPRLHRRLGAQRRAARDRDELPCRDRRSAMGDDAFTLPLSALLLLGGAAGDLYGRRRTMLLGIALFTAASLLCAIAPSLALFLAARALQGLGAALLLPNSLAILSASFTGEARGAARSAPGRRRARSPARSRLARRLAGRRARLAVHLSPQRADRARRDRAWLFFVPESANEERPAPDWAGAALGTLGLGALTFGLTAWSASGRIGNGAGATLAMGVALLLAFLWVEWRRGGKAMVPLDLFGSKAFVGLTLFTFLLYGTLGGMMLLLPYTLIEAAHYRRSAPGSRCFPSRSSSPRDRR